MILSKTSYPGTIVNTDGGEGAATDVWNGVDNAKESDDLYASSTINSGDRSDFLDCSNFNFSDIPDGVDILGIEVRIEKKGSLSTGVRDKIVRLLIDGSPNGNNKAQTSLTWNNVDTVVSYGGENDLWGLPLNLEDIQKSTFSVRIQAEVIGTIRTAYIDSVQMIVYYGFPHKTITTSLKINDIDVDNLETLKVIKSIGDINASSSFKATLNNYTGRLAGSYDIGNSVEIYADRGVSPPTTKIFNGVLENIEYSGRDNFKEKITLSGRDYTAKLQDSIVPPESYSNLLAGSIVKDLINKYANEITYNNVDDSSTIISGIQFKYDPIFDAIKNIAQRAGYIFYVDLNKDLNFKEKSSVSSNLVFDNTNIVDAKFNKRRDTVFNDVIVRGDNYLSGYEETFIAGSPLGGSVFQLEYKPHNSNIQVDSVFQKGGIYQLGEITSGTNYLVDYEQKNIIFTSGTDLGNSIPSSGAQVLINYDRNLAIIASAQNKNSQTTYGKRTKVIIDKTIRTPSFANDIAQLQIANSSSPKLEGNILIKDIIAVTPSQTCVVNVPFYNISGETYDILEANYDFNKTNNHSGKVLSLKINEKIPDLTDSIKNIHERLRRLEADRLDSSDLLTRQEVGENLLAIVGSTWLIEQGFVTGSVSYLYGSFYTPPTYPFLLGSTTNQGICAGSFTGSAVAYDYQSIISGGQF